MKLEKANLTQTITSVGQKLIRYRVLIFVVLLGAVYGYILFTINTLTNIQPSTTSVTKEFTELKTPRIDQSVVRRLQDLRDNSVSVKALFDKARDNPFNE